MAAADECPAQLLQVEELLQRLRINVFAAIAGKDDPGVLAVLLVVVLGPFLQSVVRAAVRLGELDGVTSCSELLAPAQLPVRHRPPASCF